MLLDLSENLSEQECERGGGGEGRAIGRGSRDVPRSAGAQWAARPTELRRPATAEPRGVRWESACVSARREDMAIPFNLPTDEQTEDNYRRLDQLLVDLYSVLRQILFRPRCVPEFIPNGIGG